MWLVQTTIEWMLAVFDNDSINCILHVRHRDCIRQNCGGTSASLAYGRSSVQRRLLWFGHVHRVDRSRTFYYPHRLPRGENDLDANWTRGPWDSRNTWNFPLDREYSATHWLNESPLWIRTGQSSRDRLRAWLGQLDWWCWLNSPTTIFFFWPRGTFSCGLFLLKSEINYATMPNRGQKTYHRGTLIDALCYLKMCIH